MFDQLDKNFDGQLSWQEFIGEETTIERAFKLFDEKSAGAISKAVSYLLSYNFNFCVTKHKMLSVSPVINF